MDHRRDRRRGPAPGRGVGRGTGPAHPRWQSNPYLDRYADINSNPDRDSVADSHSTADHDDPAHAIPAPRAHVHTLADEYGNTLDALSAARSVRRWINW